MAESVDVPEWVATTLRDFERVGINLYDREAIILRCAVIGQHEVRAWLEVHQDRYFEVLVVVVTRASPN
jgi:hypothetical protein